MDISRHEFLAMLHKLLRPKVYLEIGVQYGQSLILAEAAQVAYGIDPNPLLFAAPQNQLPNQRVHSMTSDEFFGSGYLTEPIDLAFIDGSHLMEDALVDFVNVQRRMRPGGTIVFDDVLPYSEAIASREQPPGDWTGDVWKCYFLLDEMYRALAITTPPILVDTWPTGTMVLTSVEPNLHLPSHYSDKKALRDVFQDSGPVPSSILNRTIAVHPDVVLDKIREERGL
jgi:SAM-dependent methyltransferase